MKSKVKKELNFFGISINILRKSLQRRKKMTEVTFSFDDEDFITPEADEAAEFWAKTLKERESGFDKAFPILKYVRI